MNSQVPREDLSSGNINRIWQCLMSLHDSIEAQRYLEEEVEVIAWHGTRRKESIEDLKKNGFCTFSSNKELLDAAREAIGLTIKSSTPNNIIDKAIKRGSRHFLTDPRRGALFITGREEDACRWAYKNPEIVYNILFNLLPVADEHKIPQMLKKGFGRSIKIKLRAVLPREDIMEPRNIPTYKICIKPEDIIDIEECEAYQTRIMGIEEDE